MRKNIKTTEAIFPMPVLMVATYNEDESVDVMNAAWGTMLSRNQVILNLTETHKTVKNIKERKAFTVSIADSNTEKFIDVNTGLAIKMIDNQNNQTVDYKYEYGIVTDSDVERPDTTGYIVNN